MTRASAGRLEAARADVMSETAASLFAVDGDRLAGFAARLLEAPRRWYVSGQGRSGLVARMVGMRMMHLGTEVHVVGGTTTPALRAGDGLLVVSRSGETLSSVALAERAQELGAVLLAVTAGDESRLAGLAEATLVVAAEPSEQFGGSLFEQTALLVLDTLVQAEVLADPGLLARMEQRHANLE